MKISKRSAFVLLSNAFQYKKHYALTLRKLIIFMTPIIIYDALQKRYF